MREVRIDKNWKFEDIVKKAKALRQQYEGVLASFTYLELHEQVEFRKNLRDAIYSLKMETFQKNKIWEYMNDYLEYEELDKSSEK